MKYKLIVENDQGERIVQISSPLSEMLIEKIGSFERSELFEMQKALETKEDPPF